MGDVAQYATRLWIHDASFVEREFGTRKSGNKLARVLYANREQAIGTNNSAPLRYKQAR